MKRPRLFIRHTGGFWLLTRGWSVGYYLPGSYMPLTIRLGIRGRTGWWGAAHIERLPS
jgi:hypothetical protein